MFENKEMRQVYSETLCELAQNDSRVVVLEADLMKSSGTQVFKDKFPQRFIDVGVAEQSMISIAAGLSNMGKIPFASSFTAFATRRPFDQITISVAYAGLNVKIVAMDPGVTAELNGGTHMSFEDVALMRSIPGAVIVEPVDSIQLYQFMKQAYEMPGLVYMRVYRKTKELFFNQDDKFTIGKGHLVKEGKDVTIVASGIMLKQALNAAQTLDKLGISARVVNIHTVKPIDKDIIIESAKKTGAVVVAENHNIINGLCSAVSEVLSENYPVIMSRIGVRDHFGEVGKVDFLMKKYKMTAEDIVESAKDIITKKR